MDFDSLFAKRSTHIKPGLQRIERSYEFLNRPAAHIPAVLIGGTNGKGSTSGFLWSLLALNDRTIGLYSSPHLAAFSERCQLSRNPCQDEDLAKLWRQLQAQLPADLYQELSFFEIATILAFMMFEQRSVDFQVLEVGLGGLWDATNVSDPLLSAVVSLSKDHEEYLGSDLLGILHEKLGIMRAGRPLFWGDSGEILGVPGYHELIEARAKALHAPLFEAGREFFYHDDHKTISIQLPGLPPCTLPCSGIVARAPLFLRKNLALAAAMYHYVSLAQAQLKLRPLMDIWPEFIVGSQAAPVTLFGRSQRLLVPSAQGPVPLLLDVCHNPDGAQAFVDGLTSRGLTEPLPALVSILKDKEMDRILDVLRSRLHPVILFGIDHERAWQPELLSPRHRALPFYGSFEEAWQQLLGMRQPTDGPVAVCGSVLVVGRVLQHFESAPKDGISIGRILCGDW